MTRDRLPSTNLGAPVLALFTMACALPVLAATNISTCTTINAPGNYSLAADLTCSPGADGIDITASGVSLALNGHVITGTSTAYAGISVGAGSRLNHVAITGPGLIRGFGAGVVFNGADYSQIGLVTVSSNPVYPGIVVVNSTYITVGSNIVVRNPGGVELSGTSNSVVQSNNVSGNTGDGITVSGASANNTINNNTVDGNGGSGIRIYAGTNTRLSANSINGNVFGLALDGGGSVATNNTSLGNSGNDMYDGGGCAGNAYGGNVFFLANAPCIH